MLKKLRTWMSTLGFRQIRRVIIFVLGMTVLVFGVALLVLPGPAIVVIPAGLAILGIEFRWARRWMREAKRLISKGMNSASAAAANMRGQAPSSPCPPEITPTPETTPPSVPLARTQRSPSTRETVRKPS